MKITAETMKEILYPRRFLSIEEVADYVGGDVITCLICDRSFKRLSKHISSGHGCDHNDYKDILNIPRTVSLYSADSIQELTEKGRHRFHHLMTDKQRKFLTDGGHNKTGFSGQLVSTISKDNKLAGARLKGKNRGKKHGRTQGKCHDCGVIIEISTQRINRRTLCKKCLIKNHKKLISEWQKNNRDRLKENRLKRLARGLKG